VTLVREALDRSDVKIVEFGWLAESLKATKKVDETPYFLYDPANNGTNDPSHTPDPPKEVSKKRQRDAKSEGDDNQLIDLPKSKKQKDGPKDGQKAKSAPITVPIDEGCPLVATHQVHIDDNDGTIYDVTLNQSNSGNNNNKFYRIQILANAQSFQTWTRWGRVGEFGQNAMLGDGSFDDALKHFQKKFKDKTGHKWDDRLERPKPGKYTFIERNYEDSSNEDNDDLPRSGKRRGSKESLAESAASVESKLPGPVQRLMKLIFNQEYFDQTLAALDYDANKMPLGKLSKRTLKSGYEILKDIAALIGDNSLAASQYNTTFGEAVEQLSNAYLSTIPHDFGRRRPPVLREINLVKKEIELLENLTDMQLANEIMKTAKGNKQETSNVALIDRQYEGLGMQEITPLEIKSKEFQHLQNYLKKCAGATHGMRYKIHDIFRIERQGENDRFVTSPYANIQNSDRRLLWHGSRVTNYGGILSQGLRIAPPEAPVSGYMFGKGVYLADISTKSAGYCAAMNSGNIGLLLLCEAELGKPPLKLTNADYNAGDRAKAQNSVSTWGVGQTVPRGWKDASCVHGNLKGVIIPDTSSTPGDSQEPGACLLYNEYIVYDVAQIRLRYLLRVEIQHGFID
jgi:poly [ADP-ribose] polymerase 2/3/4